MPETARTVEEPRPEASLHRRGERLERSAALVGVAVGVVPAILVALLVHPLVGLVVGIGLVAAWELELRRRILQADERVLGALDARRLRPGEQPRLENLVEGLCTTNGVAPPALRLLDAPGANAAVAAVDERVTFVVTRGLLEGLDRMELEGVVANLVVRARDGSAAYTTLVLSLFGASSPALRRLADAYGDQRAVRSDLDAVELTRYPPGLRRALATMHSLGTDVTPDPGVSRLLWIAPTGPAQDGRAPDGAHAGATGVDVPPAVESNEQPLALREAVLGEL